MRAEHVLSPDCIPTHNFFVLSCVLYLNNSALTDLVEYLAQTALELKPSASRDPLPSPPCHVLHVFFQLHIYSMGDHTSTHVHVHSYM